jgi:hypothetical protein
MGIIIEAYDRVNFRVEVMLNFLGVTMVSFLDQICHGEDEGDWNDLFYIFY